MASTGRSAGRRRRRRPGRPTQSDSPDVRSALLEASRTLFTKRGFHEVSTREIAAAAGVNSAMIHYYFGDKEGLYRAMLEQAFERLIGEVRRLAGSGGDDEAGPIDRVIELYATTLFRDPWIPRLMVREVLSDGAPFRDEFIERFALPVAGLVPALMAEERRLGRLRDDVDLQLATLSLMSMMVFPILALPITGKVFGFDLDEEFRDRFLAHTAKLFFEGAAPR